MAENDNSDEQTVNSEKDKRTVLDRMVDGANSVGDGVSRLKQGAGHVVREIGVHGSSVASKMGHAVSHSWKRATLDPVKRMEAENEIAEETLERKDAKHNAKETMRREREARGDGIEDREEGKKAQRQAREALREAQKGVAEKIEAYKQNYRDTHDGKEPSKHEILIEKKRLGQEILDTYHAAEEEAKRAREERQRERAEKRGYQPTQPEHKAMERLQECGTYAEAEKVLKESKERRFTLARESSFDKRTGNGLKIWDDPNFPYKENATPEYEAERKAHQVTYRMEAGKIVEIIAGGDANFVSAVQGSLVQKRTEQAEPQQKFGNVKLSVQRDANREMHDAPTVAPREEPIVTPNDTTVVAQHEPNRAQVNTSITEQQEVTSVKNTSQQPMSQGEIAARKHVETSGRANPLASTKRKAASAELSALEAAKNIGAGLRGSGATGVSEAGNNITRSVAGTGQNQQQQQR